MTGLLSHDHPDLHRGAVVLVVDVDGLIGASCDLISGGMSALAEDTYKVIAFNQNYDLINDSFLSAETDLPHVEYMLLTVRRLIRVQHQITVSSVELPVRAWVHFGQLHVLDAPHLMHTDGYSKH